MPFNKKRYVERLSDIYDHGENLGTAHDIREAFTQVFGRFFEVKEDGSIKYHPFHIQEDKETGESKVLVQNYIDTKKAMEILSTKKRDVFYEDAILKSLRVKFYASGAKSDSDRNSPSRYPEAVLRYYAGDYGYQLDWQPLNITFPAKEVADRLDTTVPTMRKWEGFPKPRTIGQKELKGYFWCDIEDYIYNNYVAQENAPEIGRLIKLRYTSIMDYTSPQMQCAIEATENDWERIVGKAQVESALHTAIFMTRKGKPQDKEMWEKTVVAFSDAIAQKHTITNYESSESKFPISFINKMIDELQAVDINTLDGDDIEDAFTKKTEKILFRIEQEIKKNMIDLAGGSPEAKNHYMLNGNIPSHWLKEMDQQPSGKISNKPLKRPPPRKRLRLFGFFGRIKGG